ncbi:MAG: hypothetical protein AAF999_11850 [Pseudomonadota bacterium]
MMLDNLNRLDLTQKDIELIESALHTQKKILSVQSQAGGTGAGHRLTELKHLIKRVNRARPSGHEVAGGSWMQSLRNYFCPADRCRQGNW